jgi:predicted ferric reductase
MQRYGQPVTVEWTPAVDVTGPGRLPTRPVAGPRPPHPAPAPAPRPSHPAPVPAPGTGGRPPGGYLPPARPVSRTGAGGRWLWRAAFWLGLAVTVGAWWLNTPTGSLTGSGPALAAAGRITGLVAGYLLITQVLLMSRLGWLERAIGAHRLTLWHRELGGFLVVAVLAHAVLITVGYARIERTGVLRETWNLLTHYEDMLSAFVATALLVGIGLLGIRALRRALPYEAWYFLHLSAYLILLLGYGHQFATGQELALAGPMRVFWAGLYVVAIAAVAWGRLVAPLALNLRHRLRVVDVVDEAPGMVSVYVSGRRLHELDVQAGQYFRWRFLGRRTWWQAHPFSLSAAPNEHWLRLTVKTVGDHTADLRALRPRTRVYVEGPSGEFTAERRTRSRALLVAGGSGIAPIRALLEELPTGAVVLYRTSTVRDLAFRQELEWLAQARGAALWYVVGGRDDPGPRHLFTPQGLRELVPDVTRRDAYLCGPQGLVDTARDVLRRLRVPRRQIHVDPFEF